MADILILTMRFQNQEHQLTRSRGVAVITSPCHGEDRGFDSRRDRLPNESVQTSFVMSKQRR